jgi:threonine aldolase
VGLCSADGDVIAEARQQRRLGGGMRQAGVIAAAGIVARDDGRRLAATRPRGARMHLRRVAGSVDPTVHTNIVCARLEARPFVPARRPACVRDDRSARCASSRTKTSMTTMRARLARSTDWSRLAVDN